MVSSGPAPSVDRGLLARLRADVGDETLRRYVDAYLALLPERLDLVGQAVAAGERAEALRMLTDVRVGASMLGVEQFAARVRSLEHAARTQSQAEVEARLALLRTSAEAVTVELRQEVRRSDKAKNGAQPPGEPPNR